MYQYDFISINFAPCVGIMFLLFFLSENSRMNTKIKNMFYLLICLEILEMIAYNWELVTSTYDHSTFLRILLSVIGYSVRPFLLYIIMLITMRNNRNRRLQIALSVPGIINVLVVSSAFFTDIAFSYTRENVFKRGPLGYCTHFTLFLYVALVVAVAIKETIHEYDFELMIIYLMAAVIIASVVIEAVFSIRSIGRTSVVLCILFYYMFFQTEEYKLKMQRKKAQINGLITKNRLDPLTGLLNKQAFKEMCTDILNDENNQSITFLFIDMDHFKDVNDNLGHTVGDKAIINTAHKIVENFREEDIKCRFGGDEFCLCLPDISYKDLCACLDSALIGLQQEYRDDEDKMSIKVTASIGAVYCINDSYVTYDRMIALADEAVYEAKKTGRDTYVIKTGC